MARVVHSCRDRGSKTERHWRPTASEREERALLAASRQVDGAAVSDRPSLIAHHALLRLRMATRSSACSNLRMRVMRVLVRRLPNISPQQKPVRKSQVRQTLVIPKGGNNNSHPRQPFDISAALGTTVAVDSRSALVCAEPPCASSPRSCSTISLFTPAAQQLGGALNILPSPFLWSWALVGFRWTRRRLDCLRFGRSLIEAEAASQYTF